jgi:hypothetical protein
MSLLLLIGVEEALAEGLVQGLAGQGHQVVAITSAREAAEALAHADGPATLLLLPCEGVHDPALSAVAPTSAIVLYRTHADQPPCERPSPVARRVVAELMLPLERLRLAKLLDYFGERARLRGERDPEPPPEQILR